MTRGQIQAAFDALLATVTNGGDIRIQDGTVYTPQQGRPFLAGKLSAYARTPLGIGPNTPNRYDGSYTVTIFRPSSEGTGNCDIMGGIIANLFARGTELATGTNTSIQILSSSEQQLETDADWVSLPVVVSWLGTDPMQQG
jgi:hypothetical protein